MNPLSTSLQEGAFQIYISKKKSAKQLQFSFCSQSVLHVRHYNVKEIIVERVQGDCLISLRAKTQMCLTNW